MIRLFKALSVTYGQKFTSLLVDDATVDAMNQVWWAMIKKYDLKVIAAALDRMPFEYVEWPPTAGQFEQLCAACQPREEYDPALPPPRTKEQTDAGLAALGEMKKILGVK